MNKYTTNFLSIVNNPDNFEANEPADLIFDAIRVYAELGDLTADEAAVALSTRPEYGSEGQAGGVNVSYSDETGDSVDVEYTTSDISTWMTLEALTDQALCSTPNCPPNWFDDEWIKAA